MIHYYSLSGLLPLPSPLSPLPTPHSPLPASTSPPPNFSASPPLRLPRPPHPAWSSPSAWCIPCRASAAGPVARFRGGKSPGPGESRPRKSAEGQLHHERGNLEPRTSEKINVLGCDTRLETRFGPDFLIRPPMEPGGRIKGNPVKIRDEPVAVIGDESHGDHWPARGAGKVWRVGRSESQKTCPGTRQDP